MTPPADDHLVGRLRGAGCVFAEEEAELLRAAAPAGPTRDALVRRRMDGEPLEHVLGRVVFAGQGITLGSGVFVPRRRSELLVELAGRCLQDGTGRERSGVAVDLCCGSGAVGLGLLRSAPAAVRFDLHLVDVDERALGFARANARRVPAAHRVAVHRGDLFAALPLTLCGRVDVLVAVPPYVPTGDVVRMPPEARDHEPRLALDGGVDGLAVTGRIVAGLARWLAPAGVAVLETAGPQLAGLRTLVGTAGLTARTVRRREPEAVAVVVTRG